MYAIDRIQTGDTVASVHFFGHGVQVQTAHNLGTLLAIGAGQIQRALVFPVHQKRVGAVAEQFLHNGQVASENGFVQRRVALGVLDVDFGAAVAQYSK